MTDHTGQALIIGAGIAGLFTAITLAEGGREVIIVERDAAPDSSNIDHLFEHWKRSGAPQVRHTHALRARFCEEVRRRHPSLYRSLVEAGTPEIAYADSISPAACLNYVPAAEDARLRVLASRRSTLEAVLHRHLHALPNVTFKDRTTVTGLLLKTSDTGAPIAIGVSTSSGPLVSELLIDASGRSSKLTQWLREAGIVAAEEGEECGLKYFSRFYQMLPHALEPPERRARTGDLGYLKFGVIPADNGCFSITFAIPDTETTLWTRIQDQRVFNTVCANLPGVAPWIEATRARPLTKIAGMSDLRSHWREIAPRGQPLVLNLLAVGDTLIRSNPLYGRGCTFAVLQAHLLCDTLTDTTDPIVRARLYQEKVTKELRPFYDDMVLQDRASLRRAKDLDANPTMVPWRVRVRKYYARHGVEIAMRRYPDLMRAAMRSHHMLDLPNIWLRRPAAIARILLTWMYGPRRNARFYEAPGPTRATLLAKIDSALCA
jgi:2-polyprenyl-6-methoxyphenol hydroxylase-like FAD-dependent oxidoreductase